jgi:hypothetical protein
LGCGGGGGLNMLPAVSALDLTGSKAASDAKDAQVGAANSANSMQQKMYDQNSANLNPYIQSGQTNLASLNSQMPDLTRKFSANDFQADPGYQFTLNQGLNSMQRSAAAKGFLDSTGTMMNLNNYAQDAASTQYGNAYNRFTQNQQQRYNMLSGMSQQGLQAGGALAGVGQNYANAYGQNMSSIGNANAASMMAAHNGQMKLIGMGAQAAGMMGGGGMFSGMGTTGGGGMGGGQVASTGGGSMGGMSSGSGMNGMGASSGMGGGSGMGGMAGGADASSMATMLA